MIAYDFDGVLITDYSYVENCTDGDFQKVAKASFPFFEPQGKYVIITARGPDLIDETREILSRIKNQPYAIYFKHDQRLDPAGHKASVLNKLSDVNMFVESSPEQATAIQQLWSGRVLHFGSWIQDNLKI
jgi:hypothetical protein